MLGETVDEVEVEVAEELGAIVLDDKHYPHRGLVELGKGLRHGLPHYHVALEEEEELHDQLLELKPLLEVVTALLLLRDLKLSLDGPFFISGGRRRHDLAGSDA